MNEAFTRLDEEKQKRIRDAAMAEFAQYGYEQASTNRIVKAADIGKGMLFHYFNSKLELFRYLVDYGLDYVTQQYMARVDPHESDFIEKLRQWAHIKFEAFINDPHLFKFLGSVYLNDVANLTAQQRERLEAYQEQAMTALYSNLDTSIFRSDVPPEQSMRILRWAMDGYQQELIARLQAENLASVDMKPYWDEFFEVLAVLKRIFYKGEVHGDGSAGNP